jgi:Zn-finger nucleic acid-binding protein
VPEDADDVVADSSRSPGKRNEAGDRRLPGEIAPAPLSQRRRPRCGGVWLAEVLRRLNVQPTTQVAPLSRSHRQHPVTSARPAGVAEYSQRSQSDGRVNAGTRQ